MKIRNGFVSNSSSSSFIVRKSALTKEQYNELKKLLDYHNDQFETEIQETYLTFEGSVEAHNETEKYGEPLAGILMNLMDEWNIKINYDWNIEYGGFYDWPPLIERD